MLQNLDALLLVILLVTAAICLMLFFRWLGQSPCKKKYSKNLFFGQLYSETEQRLLGSSPVDGDLVTEGASVYFSHKRIGGSKAGTRAVCIKLGDLDFFIARGLPDKTAQFTKACQVKLYANGTLVLNILLSDCKLEGRCVTGFEDNGCDFSLVFGHGLTIFMDYS